jgi:hypothetical protein
MQNVREVEFGIALLACYTVVCVSFFVPEKAERLGFFS